jgi:Beta-lactamase
MSGIVQNVCGSRRRARFPGQAEQRLWSLRRPGYDPGTALSKPGEGEGRHGFPHLHGNRLRVDQVAPIAAWAATDDPRHAVTIDQLLRMDSGLPLDETDELINPMSRMFFLENDMAGYAAKMQLAHPPGTAWATAAWESGMPQLKSLRSCISSRDIGLDTSSPSPLRSLTVTPALPHRHPCAPSPSPLRRQGPSGLSSRSRLTAAIKL